MGLLASGTMESFVQLITTLLIFAFVLFITFWTSKFIAGYEKQKMMTGNMEVVETLRIAPGKYLQVVRAGQQYFVIALGKDTVSFIAQLSPEELNLKENNSVDFRYTDFKSILEKAKNSRKKQADDNE